MSQNLKKQSERLQTWLRHKALPLWEKVAIDENGGWYESLDLASEPHTDSVRRLRVQARQIYVYSLAQKMGWHKAESLINRSVDFLIKYGFEPDSNPGFIHRLGPNYDITDGRRDFYDHAFFLLASGWAYYAVGNLKALTLISKTTDFIEGELSSPEKGWLEAKPHKGPRRQNPHMHFLEASMALYDMSGDRKWMDYAHHVFNLFKAHFFDDSHHIIREYFKEDWSPLNTPKGQSVEPGHAAEWVWLLKRYEERSGIDTSDYAQKLYDRICDTSTTFLNDEEQIDGTPIRTTKRLWVQTEFIKAHLAQANRYPKTVKAMAAQNKAADTINALLDTYLRENGTWIDQTDKSGRPVSKTVPTSTFYHIICMIDEVYAGTKLPTTESLEVN